MHNLTRCICLYEQFPWLKHSMQCNVQCSAMCCTMQFVAQSKTYVRATHYHHLAANSVIKDIIHKLRYVKECLRESFGKSKSKSIWTNLMQCNAQYNAMHLSLCTISLIKTFNAMYNTVRCAVQCDLIHNPKHMWEPSITTIWQQIMLVRYH